MNDPTRDPELENEPLPPHHAVVRAALSEVGQAPDEHREQAVAAALAVFDAHHAVPSLSAARAAKASRMRRWNLALGAAAAVVALGVVGTNLLRGMSGSDEESASMMTVASEAADAGAALAPAEAPSNSDQKLTSESVVAAEGGQLEGLTTTAAAVERTIDTTNTPGIIGPAFVTPVVSTPEELLTLPEVLPSDPALPSLDTEFTCDLLAGDTVIGRITYGPTDAVAVRTADGGVIAFDLQCAVLAEVKP